MGACNIKCAPYIRVMPDKPIKRGWKFWVLADKRSKTIVDTYLDDHNLRTEHTSALPQKFGGTLLTRFAGHLAKPGYHFVADRFFNNPAGAIALLNMGHTVTGTWDTRFRFLADKLKLGPKKPTLAVPRGSWKCARAFGGAVHGWQFMDCGACSMIDTHFGFVLSDLQRKTRAGPGAGQIEYIQGPQANASYQHIMTAVDQIDQVRASKKGFGSTELNRRRGK